MSGPIEAVSAPSPDDDPAEPRAPRIVVVEEDPVLARRAARLLAPLGTVTHASSMHDALDDDADVTIVPRADATPTWVPASLRGPNDIEQVRRRLDQRFGLEQFLGRAIDRRELRVVYQPILEIASREPVGFEALVRWTSPTWGELSATEIIEIAETTGQIARIGEYVLADALDVVGEARRIAGPGSSLWVAVNLSSREFAITDPVARCSAMLEARAVPPDALRFELTESAVMDDVGASIGQLSRLRELGVRVALDDFGTGHSSLSYLTSLPVSALKIDHSFVWSLAAGPRNRAIIEAIVTMARALDLELCAEGIETPEQLAALAALGVDEGQGYYFSLPLEPDELLAYVDASVALPAAIAFGAAGGLTAV